MNCVHRRVKEIANASIGGKYVQMTALKSTKLEHKRNNETVGGDKLRPVLFPLNCFYDDEYTEIWDL